MNCKNSVRAACFCSSNSTNHLDHLGVMAYILEIPLILDDEYVLAKVRHYYPQVQPIYIPKNGNILEFLAQNYDALFVSSSNYPKKISSLLEIIFQKKLQFWYCPHGHSDKPIDHLDMPDLFLFYGESMKQQLAKTGVLPTLRGSVRTGNYRMLFYQRYRNFYDQLCYKEVLSQFPISQPLFLYVPTWNDERLSSSLFEVGNSLIEQLPDHYNLLIKLHPWIEHQKPGFVHHLLEKYRNKPNLVILKDYPPVLPLLDKSSLYLGDFSSIGYDFLFFNRPMFFFDPLSRKDKERMGSNELHQCGTIIPNSAYSHLYSWIDQHKDKQLSLAPLRTQMYNATFGNPISFPTLKKSIENQIAQIHINR